MKSAFDVLNATGADRGDGNLLLPANQVIYEGDKMAKRILVYFRFIFQWIVCKRPPKFSII